jgi:uncharacterized protein YdeI (YjbR/CyaY-like superfamily)
MKYSGVLHLQLPRAALTRAGAEDGSVVTVTLGLDDDGLQVPPELLAALATDAVARAAWKALRPSRQRVCVTSIESAKQPATRACRLERVLNDLRAT